MYIYKHGKKEQVQNQVKGQVKEYYQDPDKSKSKMAMIIIAVIAVVVLVGAGVYLYRRSKSSSRTVGSMGMSHAGNSPQRWGFKFY